MNRSLMRLVATAILGTALAATLVGCSGDSDSDSGGTSDSPAAARAPEVADADRAGAASLAEDAAAREEAAPEVPRAVIRKGNVALRADDVGRARIEVQKVVDRHAGEVTEEETQSDDDGDAAYTRLVVRVPSDDFADAVTELKRIGELESANTNEDDVTTEVIDVRTRIKVQERSIDRISILFQRAESIRDIMAIESELSRRQAELESLQQQAAYLDDQTSMSTIVVSIDRVPAKRSEPVEDDDTGFLAGLSAGWGALSTFAVGLATALGALLPWLVVGTVVGVPALLLVRSLRRRTPPAAPGDASAE
ncbi:DUF4349 domain-containing protein [Nocardioides sp. YIM 152315]|uniref:DUF4349 domain-containing protein n=1 Tax=Nocardioides sp. YIM 152315 TaxID=3031760 RepID=UPI0023DBEE63|nr:DUF4349 domain-containing protein [Nocardioides sp. YIM 152315]MDF1604025.1 DUF4349 domain-containing protein [Nocardioides sp. YIM 152315]